MPLEVRVGFPCLDPAPVAAWSDAMLWQHVTVDSAAWGLFGSVVGTAVGAFLTLLGSWNVARVEGRRAAESERRKTDAVRRQEQRAAYLRLLMICRQLRTLARAGRDRQQLELDRLRSDLSSATYEIALIAPENVAHIADELAMAVREYIYDAQVEYAADPQKKPSAALESRRSHARAVVDQFIEIANDSLSADK